MVCRGRGNPRSGGWVIQLGLVVRSGVTFVPVLDTGVPFNLLLMMELAVCLLPSKTSKDLIGWLGVTCGNKGRAWARARARARARAGYIVRDNLRVRRCLFCGIVSQRCIGPRARLSRHQGNLFSLC